MFENLHSVRLQSGITEAHYTDVAGGLLYTFQFVARGGDKAFPASTQVLSRVFAIPQSRMKGRDHSAWADIVRYELERAEQHLPIVKVTM